MSFLVTVHDPHSEHPHLTDQEFQCEGVEDLIARIEDAADLSTLGAASAAREVLTDGCFEHETDEGVEVSVRRVGELVGGRS